MGSNRFGELFSITTWGESHGKALGVVIDGCPAGIVLNEEMINQELDRRKPGQNPYTSPRKEPDRVQMLSGVFEEITTGTPISLLIWNKDVDSSSYEPLKDLLRPGHANFPYLQKYGVFDYRGGGRASARETVCRVAAGAVAKELLKKQGIVVLAYLSQVGSISCDLSANFSHLKEAVACSTFFCPDQAAEEEIKVAVAEAKGKGDSLGGVIEFQVQGVPAGWGDPVYQKLDAKFAAAMMSIPATKGVEIGSGFSTVGRCGSENNDSFVSDGQQISTATNHAGGVLGGMSTGAPIVGRVAFKPTSSIAQPQQTVDVEGNPVQLKLSVGARHDPCVALRAPAIVEAMAALVLADALLMQRSARANF